MRIPEAEFEERRERLLDQVRRLGASGYVLFDASYIQYFTGFWFLSNERPVVYAQSVSGDAAIFVPEASNWLWCWRSNAWPDSWATPSATYLE